MSTNKWKFINNIEVGEFVKTLDGDKEVLATFKYNKKPLIELTLDNGQIIKCTPEHKFLISYDEVTGNKIWKTAEELNEEDDILAL